MKPLVVCAGGIILVAALLSVWVFAAPSNPVPTITASVVDVISVDTVEVEITAVTGAAPVWVGDLVRVRLFGIEATEGAEAFWAENASFYAAMITGRTVYLAIDAAATGFWSGGDEPLLAYVYLDPDGKTPVNSLLVSMGFAEVAATADATATAEATATSSEIQQAKAQETTSAQADAEVSSEAWGVATVEAAAPAPPAACIPEPGFGCCCANACRSPCTCQEVLSLLCLTSIVRRGDYARLQIETAPGAWCQIDVRYHSGLSTDLDLSPRSAFCGVATWRWKVAAETPPGTWPIVVTARLNGAIIGRLETFITVRL